MTTSSGGGGGGGVSHSLRERESTLARLVSPCTLPAALASPLAYAGPRHPGHL